MSPNDLGCIHPNDITLHPDDRQSRSLRDFGWWVYSMPLRQMVVCALTVIETSFAVKREVAVVDTANHPPESIDEIWTGIKSIREWLDGYTVPVQQVDGRWHRNGLAALIWAVQEHIQLEGSHTARTVLQRRDADIVERIRRAIFGCVDLNRDAAEAVCAKIEVRCQQRLAFRDAENATMAREPGQYATPLDDVRIAEPCNRSWDDMPGDDRTRFCSDCQMRVFNVTAMTRNELAELMNGDGRICGRAFVRADGTLIPKDCPEGEAPPPRLVMGEFLPSDERWTQPLEDTLLRLFPDNHEQDRLG